jgi:hypothetical protein
MNYRPGNKAPQSGVYAVNHDRYHHQAHEVTLIEGETFPPCRGCGHGVTFTLVRPAVHIRKHSQF